MSSIILAVADGVRGLLEQARIDSQFAVTDFLSERSYADWDLQLEAAGSLRVDIVAVTNQVVTSLDTRGVVAYEIPVDVGIRKRFPQIDRDQDTGRVDKEGVDVLVLLTEQINEFFIPQDNSLQPSNEPGRIAGIDAAWQETTIRTIANRQHLREWSQFTGIVRVTYVARKALGL